MRVLSLALISLALAGCSSPAPDSSPGQPPLDSQVNWVFSDCFGMDTGRSYGLDQGPGDVPPGWDFEPLAEGRYATYVSMTLLRCNRMSSLGLERGPVNFLFETHSKFSPPEGCEYGNLDQMAILSRVFVNDPDIAKAFAEIGFPAVSTEINLSIENSTGVGSQTWTWVAPGHGRSELTVMGMSQESSELRITERLISWTPDRLLALDVNWQTATAQPPIPVVYGQLSSGMLISGDEDQPYLELGDYDFAIEASADLRIFGDFQCEKLLLPS